MSESLNPAPAPGTGRREGAGPISNLPSISGLFKASWRRYAASLNVFAIIYVLCFAPLALVVFVMSSVYQAMPKPVNPLIMAWLAAGGIMAALISVWGQAAFVYAATGRFQEIRKLLKQALEQTVSFAWLFLIYYLSVLAGSVFIIPGIIVWVWFSFALYVRAVEGDKGVGALIKSRQYVRGRWWAVLYRLLPVWALPMAVNIVPGIGPLFSMLFLPFAITYHCVLFEQLRAAHGPVETPAPAQKKRWALAGGSMIIMALLLAGYTLSTMNINQLKQLATDPAGAIQNAIAGDKGNPK